MTTKKNAVVGSVPLSTSTGAGSAGNSPTAGLAPSSTPTSAATRPLKGLRLKLQQMLAGVEAVIPDGTTLPYPGGGVPRAQIVQQLTDALALYTAVDVRETGLLTARQLLKGATSSQQTLVEQLKAAVVALFGKTSPLLRQFGLVIKQRTPLTPEQSVAKKARQLRTREIRHTLGPKAKAKLQYQGQVVISATLSDASASAPAAPAGLPVGTTAPAAASGASSGAQAPAAPPAGSKS